MPVGGAFLGGVSERIPAGKCLLLLQSVTEDNRNLSTASWTISSTGRTYNVTAGADGRAEQLVDSGFTYVITPSITGNYDGLTPQTVKADSTEVKICAFSFTVKQQPHKYIIHPGVIKNDTNEYDLDVRGKPGDLIVVSCVGNVYRPGNSLISGVVGTTVSMVGTDSVSLNHGPQIRDSDSQVVLNYAYGPTKDAKIHIYVHSGDSKNYYVISFVDAIIIRGE